MARVGLVSSIDPSNRLICLSVLSSASLFSGAIYATSLSLAAILLLMQEGLRFSKILRESIFIAGFALFTIVIRYFDLPENFSLYFSMNEIPKRALKMIEETGTYGARLLAAFLLGRLFYASTTASELRDATTRIVRRVPFIRRFDIGLILSLVILFIPLIFEEWKNSLEAARSRGMPRRPGISKQGIFLAAFLRRLMSRVILIPEALTARGWTRDRGITPSHLKTRDYVTMIICGGLAILSSLRIV